MFRNHGLGVNSALLFVDFIAIRSNGQTHLQEGLKYAINANLKQVPQKRYWCGAGGQLPSLTGSLPSNQDEQARQAECHEDAEGPSQRHGAVKCVCP